MSRLNKPELKLVIRKQLEAEGRYLYIKDIDFIVDAVFDIMTDELCKGNDITIQNFGTFSTTTVKEHIGRNPLDSTEFIKIPERTRVSFKTGRELKRRVNKED